MASLQSKENSNIHEGMISKNPSLKFLPRVGGKGTPPKTNISLWKSMVGRCISYWTSPVLGNILIFGTVIVR